MNVVERKKFSLFVPQILNFSFAISMVSFIMYICYGFEEDSKLYNWCVIFKSIYETWFKQCFYFPASNPKPAWWYSDGSKQRFIFPSGFFLSWVEKPSWRSQKALSQGRTGYGWVTFARCTLMSSLAYLPLKFARGKKLLPLLLYTRLLCGFLTQTFRKAEYCRLRAIPAGCVNFQNIFLLCCQTSFIICF